MALDQQLRTLINAQNLTGDPSTGRTLPAITSPLAQLGMRLFFTKGLGGEFDAACASCHHPRLGGGDALALPIGVAAIDPDLLGPGRSNAGNLPLVPRHAPTTFNAGIWDHFLFNDGRVEALNPRPRANGGIGGIRTPDSALNVADANAGPNLPAAQSRFPVASDVEMRANLLPGASNDAVRNHLAARIGNYGAGAGQLARNQWLPQFQQAFGVAGGSAQSLVTYANIATALAEYERSQVFVDTPWRDYVRGNTASISDSAKRGAVLFLAAPGNGGGAGCSGCHRGDFFTDEQFHTIAVPQIGPGKGDGAAGSDDFGRGRETGVAGDRYQYRTPSLLNVALTAPYDHDGAYATLTDVVRHYRNPAGSVNNYFNNSRWCEQPQFAALPRNQCTALYPNARANTQLALDKLQADRANRVPRAMPVINISDAQVADLVAFMQTLTDRCAANPACVSRWVPARDGGFDNLQLDAVSQNGSPL